MPLRRSVVGGEPSGLSRGALVGRGAGAVWVLLAALVAFGGAGTSWTGFREAPPAARGPSSTTDAWLGVAQIARPSDVIRAASRPEAVGGLLVLGDSRDPSFLVTAYTINYLAWPRPVGAAVCVERGTPPQVTVPLPPGVPATDVAFWGHRPPDERVGEAVGPRLMVLRDLAGTAWTSLCPG